LGVSYHPACRPPGGSFVPAGGLQAEARRARCGSSELHVLLGVHASSRGRLTRPSPGCGGLPDGVAPQRGRDGHAGVATPGDRRRGPARRQRVRPLCSCGGRGCACRPGSDRDGLASTRAGGGGAALHDLVMLMSAEARWSARSSTTSARLCRVRRHRGRTTAPAERHAGEFVLDGLLPAAPGQHGVLGTRTHRSVTVFSQETGHRDPPDHAGHRGRGGSW